jgi:NADH pyrophosphatase NudC (nudix superfamily)
MLGFDQGRPEDEPTEEELKEFDEWCQQLQADKKVGYCPICDEEIKVNSDDIMCHCPTCGHHINLHMEEEYGL